jgi:hypothetical protein
MLGATNSALQFVDVFSRGAEFEVLLAMGGDSILGPF